MFLDGICSCFVYYVKNNKRLTTNFKSEAEIVKLYQI